MPSRTFERTCVFFLAGLIAWFAASLACAQGHAPADLNALSPEERAEYFLATGQFDEALTAYKSLVENSTESSAVVRGLVRAYGGLGQRADAETYLKDRLSRFPESSALSYGLGYLCYLEKRDSEADKWFQEAVRQNPDNAYAWNNWGALKIRTKSYTEAVDMVRRAIGLNPHNMLFYNNLYRIYAEMGASGLFFAELEERVKVGDKAQARGYGKALARVWRQEGFSLYAEGNREAALKKFAQVVDTFRKIEDDEGLVPALFGLGLLYEETGDTAKARELYSEVLKLSPGHLQARERLKK